MTNSAERRVQDHRSGALNRVGNTASEPLTENAREWLIFGKNLISMLQRKSGPDITYRLSDDSGTQSMSEAEYAEAQYRDFEASALRKAYGEALRPMQDRFVTGKMTATSPEAWKVVFYLTNVEFRPKPEELGKFIRKTLGLPLDALEGGVAQQRQVVKSPEPQVLGIPGTTVQAAFSQMDVPRDATRIEHIPNRDNDGNLIGDGRRQFLLSMARMRQGLRPLPTEAELAYDSTRLPSSKDEEVIG